MKKNSETVQKWSCGISPNLIIHSLVPTNLHTRPPERKLEIPWVKEWVSRTKQVYEIYKP